MEINGCIGEDNGIKQFMKNIFLSIITLLLTTFISFGQSHHSANLIGIPFTTSLATLAMNLPNVAYIETNNYFIYRGATYGPFADQTLTISNAWNKFMRANNNYAPGGDVTYIMPGIHKVGDFPLTWPPPGYYGPSTLTLEGAGMTASVLLNTNLVPTDTLHIGTVTDFNDTVYNQYNLCLAMGTNALGANILKLGSLTGPNPATLGGLACADIENCLFTCWSSLMSSWPAFTPDVGNQGPYAGLIAINLQNSLGDKVKIDHNWFQYVAGLYIVQDHLELIGNTFEACGGNNRFPNNSPFADYTCVEFISGGQQWLIGDNEFVGSVGYTFADGHNHDIYNDDYEIFGGWQSTSSIPIIVVNGGGRITQVEPSGIQFSGYSLQSGLYDVLGNNYTDLQSDTGLVQKASFNDGLGEFQANMTNPANVFAGTFSGNGSGLTSVTASSLNATYGNIYLAPGSKMQLGAPNTFNSAAVIGLTYGGNSVGLVLQCTNSNGFYLATVDNAGNPEDIFYEGDAGERLDYGTFSQSYGNGTESGSFTAQSFATSVAHASGTVSVGSSTFDFTNETPGELRCFITDSAAYSVSLDGTTIYNSASGNAYVPLSTNEVLSITYFSTTPTLTTNAW